MAKPSDQLVPLRRDELRDRAVRALYRFGWRHGHRLPRRLVDRIVATVGAGALRHNGVHLQTLRRNLAVVVGRPVDETLMRAAVASYLRAFAEVLALPGWSRAEILDRVRTVNGDVLLRAYAERGAVVALPHSGNWDLAGAWACLSGMPVTTVAEQLGEAEFADFVAFRQQLGMEVLSHREPTVISSLVDAVRRGRLVCLLADRDLVDSGLPVRWRTEQITMPAGPAIVARRSGAALIPAVCRFTDNGMMIVFGDVVETRLGRDGLQAMLQDVADFFAATIAEAPQDWHMLQPFFAGPERHSPEPTGPAS